MINCRFAPAPLVWPRKWTSQRRDAPFRATYNSTLDLLEKELDALNARNVVIHVAMQPRDIRNDGWPRSDARKPEHPGVIVSCDTKHGARSFICDEFWDWKHNLRGIALTLERLRLADLYGVTKQGEQYAGFPALPPASSDTITTREEAAAFIAAHASVGPPSALLLDTPFRKQAIRDATRATHPDNGGSHELFLKLKKAIEVLEK